MDSLLIIEDDQRLAHMVSDYLTQSGFQVVHAPSGQSGLDAVTGGQPPDLVILDLMLPAKGDPMDRVVGLELGADDYMPKPFEPRELLARIRAVPTWSFWT